MIRDHPIVKTRKLLTDSVIRAAKPGPKPYKLSDSGRLYLLVSTAGKKYWKLNYRLDHRDCTYAIGEYPHVGLQEARELRDAARKLISDGVHPEEHKKEAIRLRRLAEADTFWGVAEEWMAHKSPGWSPYYAKQVKTYLERYVRDGELGALPVSKVVALDVVRLIRGVASRATKSGAERKSVGAPSIAINLRQWCSSVFRYAVLTGRLGTNPIADLQTKDLVIRPPVKNNRPLSPEEIRGLLAKLKEYKGARSVAIATELLLLTFVRTGELRAATWGEFSLSDAVWTIPAARMKVKGVGDHVVPLSLQVIALLRELASFRGCNKTGWLFPNTRQADSCMSATTINRALERMGLNGEGSIGFSAHGFRGTASTLLNEMGFRYSVIESQLAHRDRNQVAATYNKAQYIPERIRMMQKWADYIDTLRF